MLCCSCLFAAASAQDPAKGFFQRYNVGDGLANNLAFDVAEDKHGFIWVTTRNGISKFDGSDFTTYRPVPPGVGDQVAQFYQTIFPGKDGSLWFCSWGNGLIRLDVDTEQFTFYRHDPDDPETIASNDVWFAFEDKDGMIWVSSLGGLSRLDPRTGKARVYRHVAGDPNSLSSDTPTRVVQDKAGKLWIGTYGGGLDRFDPDTRTFTHFRHDESDANSLSNDFVEYVFLDRDGTFWISTDGGLNHFDPVDGRFKRYQHDSNDPGSLDNDVVMQAQRDSQGRLWMSHWGGGIDRLDEATGKFTHFLYDPGDPLGLSTNLVQYFREAHDGTLWFATSNGLDRFDERGGRFFSMLPQQGLPGMGGDNIISGASQDRKGRLWITSNDLGLLRYDPAGRTYRRYRSEPDNPSSLSSDDPTSVTTASDGAIWIGTHSGFDRYDAATDSFDRFTVSLYGTRGMASDNVSDITTDRQGAVWLAMYGAGLQKFEPGRKRFTLYRHVPDDPSSLANDQTNVVRVASDGLIWVGSDSGLSRLDPATAKFTNFTAGRDGLSSVIVNAIAEGRDGVMLIGTDVGVNIFDPRSGKFTAYTVRQGMPSNYVMALEADRSGDIWAATDKGLARIDGQSGKIRVYDVNDGLPSNQFWNRATYQGPDGTLYFGSTNGLVSFRPDQLRDNPVPPPVYITEFSLFQHKVLPGPDSPLKSAIHLTREMTLDHRQSSLGFKFAALNYRWSGQNKYAYKLEGFDSDWTFVDSSDRHATYTNLAPGHYVFRVKASNNDGIWNEQGVSLAITITPPWWQAWWFRLSVILALLAAAHLAYRLRVRQLRHRTAVLQELVAERTRDLTDAKETAEIANRAKSVFLASMSHELRTPLNAILGFSDIMRKSAQLAGDARSRLDIIIHSGNHLLDLINDILDVAKIESGRIELADTPFDLGALVRDVADLIQLRAVEKGLRLLVEQSSSLPRYIRGDETRLRQVLINLAGNAVKFTKAGGISLRLGTTKDAPFNLIIEVEDTGPGIKPEDQQRIFEPFVQLNGKAGSGGSGLGLTITRQFVSLMGGNLTLRSIPGEGSLFRVELPLKMVPESEFHPDGVTDRGDVVGLVSGQPELRILIAEDQRENQLLLTELMESVGIEVKIAATGKEAVDLFQSWKPHLIWMDRRMPGMDGIEATKAIRSLPGGEDVKIIAVTASAFQEQRAELLNAGMDDFLRKPYRAHEIYDCLAQQLGVRYLYSTARDPVPPPKDAGLNPDSFSALPDEVREELRSVLNSLDSQRIDRVVAKIAQYDAELHASLVKCAENFDYETILKAL